MGIFTNYSNKSDEALMVSTRKGDHRAFSCLYDRYAHRLKSYFFRMLWSDGEMAEDHVQELFSKIIEKPALFDVKYAFQPWLFRVASNMCKNTYRKRSFEREYLDQLDRQGIELPTIEHKIDESLLLDELHLTLEGMDEDRKSLFLLKYQQDLSIKELSVLFGLPEGTIKTRLFHIKKKISARLEHTLNVVKHEKN